MDVRDFIVAIPFDIADSTIDNAPPAIYATLYATSYAFDEDIAMFA